jgi:hypothetical protein
MPTPEPIPSSIVQLLDLFERGALQGVRFPDVDGPALAALAESVRESAAAVAEAEEALALARTALAERQQALIGKGQRALAYARIYAEGSAELRAELERIGLPAPRSANDAPAAPPRKRGRPPKPRPDTSLFTPAAPPSLPEQPAIAAE